MCEKKVGEKENGVQCGICDNGGMLLVQGYAKRNIRRCKRVPQRMSRYCTGTALSATRIAVVVLKMIKVMKER